MAQLRQLLLNTQQLSPFLRGAVRSSGKNKELQVKHLQIFTGLI